MLRLTSLMPWSILFCDGERLGILPCSWAPLTFLTVDGLSRYKVLAKCGPGNAWFEDDGLHSVYHGIKLVGIESGNNESTLLLKDISSADMYAPILNWNTILAALQADPHTSACSREASHTFKKSQSTARCLRARADESCSKCSGRPKCRSVGGGVLFAALQSMASRRLWPGGRQERQLDDEFREAAKAFAQAVDSPYTNASGRDGENC